MKLRIPVIEFIPALLVALASLVGTLIFTHKLWPPFRPLLLAPCFYAQYAIWRLAHHGGRPCEVRIK